MFVVGENCESGKKQLTREKVLNAEKLLSVIQGK